jgi:hypothetical protein
MWKANGKSTTLSLFLDSLFPKTDVLEEAVDLSYDRLLMNECMCVGEGERALACFSARVALLIQHPRGHHIAICSPSGSTIFVDTILGEKVLNIKCVF